MASFLHSNDNPQRGAQQSLIAEGKRKQRVGRKGKERKGKERKQKEYQKQYTNVFLLLFIIFILILILFLFIFCSFIISSDG